MILNGAGREVLTIEGSLVVVGIWALALGIWAIRRHYKKTKLHTKEELDYINFKKEIGIE